jgi:dTMP kinase
LSEVRFVTLEGIEGSGKSLQLQFLEGEFRRRGIPYTKTLEPGGTAFGREVRNVLLQTEGAAREPISELLLYLADRYQHLKEVVEPCLKKGLWVLSDRYHDATVVYQGYARGIGLDRVNELARVLGIRAPDLTLVFDLEVRLALDRARARNTSQNNEDFARFEEETIEFHEKVRAGYLLLARQEPERVAVIDGRGSPEEVFRRVLKLLDERL